MKRAAALLLGNGVLIPSAVLAALSVPVTPAAANDAAVLHSPLNEARSSPAPLWTGERMRAAEEPGGAFTPASGTDGEEAPAAAEAEAGPELLATPTRLATVGSDREVEDHQFYPQRTHGIIFGTEAGSGSDFSCSGTVVSSSGRNLVYTAAHCVYDKESGQFARDLIFVPAYKGFDSPYRTYGATDLIVPEAWRSLPYPDANSVDMAVITLDGPAESAIGSRGLRTDLDPAGRSFDIYGYPARPRPPYNGERPIHCPEAAFAGYEDELYPVADPSIIARPCFMMQGSSGGGWVIEGGYVNSVVSHGFCEIDAEACGSTHGPYFDADARALYEAAGGGAGEPTESDACIEAAKGLRTSTRAQRRAAKKLAKAKRGDSRRKVKKAKRKLKRAKRMVRSAKRQLEGRRC